MKQLIFITGNQRKFTSAQDILTDYGIDIIQNAMDTPEIQDEDISKVAEYSARYASEQLNKPVIKVDVGFEIEALNGFPGPFSKHINKWLPPEKILKLMENEKNRKAKFIDVVAFCDLGKGPISFISETPGTISEKVEGEKGWGIDQIFIPKSFSRTLAFLTDKERKLVWNNSHWLELVKYLGGK